MKVSAKADYAVRAALELAAAPEGVQVKAEKIAAAQAIPRKFLDTILQNLRQAGLVESRRGPEGGHHLARPAGEISIADVIRAVDGPLVGVSGRPPESVSYDGPAAALRDTWIAARASLRAVLENVTLADVCGGTLPPAVADLTADSDAWARR
jgi:Rrf2 family protein